MVAQNAGHWSLLVSNMLNISQCSVATRLRYGGIFHQQLHYKFTADCKSKRVLKIGHHVAKLPGLPGKLPYSMSFMCTMRDTQRVHLASKVSLQRSLHTHILK